MIRETPYQGLQNQATTTTTATTTKPTTATSSNREDKDEVGNSLHQGHIRA